MKFDKKSSGSGEKVELNMTPMIDVVFQLLTFFLFTMKIVKIEGDFNIKMPLASTATSSIEIPAPPLPVRITARPDGTMNQIKVGDETVTSFDALRAKVLAMVGRERGPEGGSELEVEFDLDHNLKYSETMRAITSVTGYMQNGSVVRLIEKIKFAPPRPEGGGAE